MALYAEEAISDNFSVTLSNSKSGSIFQNKKPFANVHDQSQNKFVKTRSVIQDESPRNQIFDLID